MSLSATYQAFLNSPSADALADNATLHYVPTLTSINEATAILKHLAVQEKLVKKKGHKVLSVVEGRHELALDVETALEFVSSGGAYLPGLDDNFVSDRTVSFPMIHIVHFDKAQKIVQVRLYWDQASLLKQIDVIGARARNWPIRDGKDQTRLIVTNAAMVADPASASSSRRSTTSRGRDDVSVTDRPIGSRSATNDPHASLSLFQPRDINQELGSSYSDRPAAPRATSMKPPPREYGELFAAAEGEATTPVKDPEIPVKSGGGKNFKPNRLFDEETEEERIMATPMSVKTNAKKYNHFELGNDDDESTPKVHETRIPPRDRSKHQSQWDFEDFVTPDKPRTKILAQAVRHIGWSDDEDDTSPVRRPVVHKARPDADPHFNFEDEDTPIGQKTKDLSSKGRLHNKGLGLYKDHVTNTTSDDEDNAPKGDVKRSHSDITTAIKNESRSKDFAPHWEMKDEEGVQKDEVKQPLGDVTTAIRNDNRNKDFAPHWEMKDDGTPDTKSQPKRSNGIKTSGNGMGGRSNVGRGWAIGDSDDESTDVKAKAGKTPGPPQSNANGKENKKTYGIKTAGNGMGGRSDVSRGWGIGDSDDEPTPQVTQPKPKAQENKGFWDF